MRASSPAIARRSRLSRRRLSSYSCSESMKTTFSASEFSCHFGRALPISPAMAGLAIATVCGCRWSALHSFLVMLDESLG